MRRRVAAAMERPRPPADQVRPVVERWVTTDEIGQHTFRAEGCSACAVTASADLDPLDPCSYRLRSLARRRWSAARRAWFAKHNVPLREQCALWPSFGLPVWGKERGGE